MIAELGEAKSSAFDADADGLGLLVSVRGSSLVSTSDELWSSRRDTSGTFDAPIQFHTSADGHILDLSVAVAPGGNAVLAWIEWAVGVMASVYERGTNSWSEPVVLKDDWRSAELTELTASFDAAGNPRVAYESLYPSQIFVATFDGQGDAWGEPVPVAAHPVSQDSIYAVYSDLSLKPLVEDAVAPPGVPLGDCAGY